MIRKEPFVFGSIIVSFCVGACISPSDRFNEFVEAVPTEDSTMLLGCGDMELPDFSGEFYMVVEPNIAAGTFIEFIATVSLDLSGEEATADFSFQPLCVQGVCGDRLQMPEGDPLVQEGVVINNECQFEVPFEDVFVEGDANPVSGSPIEGDVQVVGTVQSDEFFCGEFNGILTAPIPNLDLAGSTFGAIAIEPGTIGQDLPERVFTCP